MRTWIFVVLLAACGTSSAVPESCPEDLTEGSACAFSGRCWHYDDFSSCLSQWCTCTGGHVTCDGIGAHEGGACADLPISSCEFEGNPDCHTPPTAQGCSCDASGTWSCYCSCYGGETCDLDPCSLSPDRIGGWPCADPGQVCAFPNNASCRCEAAPDGTAQFVCT